MTVVNFLSSHQNLPYFKNTVNTYTGLTAEPAPGRSVANYPNAKYVSAERLETQGDYHPHVRTGVQLKHKS